MVITLHGHRQPPGAPNPHCVPIRECSDGTWIARVSVVRVVLNIDTFRKRRDIQVILPDMTTKVMCMCHLRVAETLAPGMGVCSYGGRFREVSRLFRWVGAAGAPSTRASLRFASVPENLVVDSRVCV